MAPTTRQHCRRIKDKDGHKRGHCIGTPGNIALSKDTTGRIRVSAAGQGRKRPVVKKSDPHPGTSAMMKRIRAQKVPKAPAAKPTLSLTQKLEALDRQIRRENKAKEMEVLSNKLWALDRKNNARTIQRHARARLAARRKNTWNGQVIEDLDDDRDPKTGRFR